MARAQPRTDHEVVAQGAGPQPAPATPLATERPASNGQGGGNGQLLRRDHKPPRPVSPLLPPQRQAVVASQPGALHFGQPSVQQQPQPIAIQVEPLPPTQRMVTFPPAQAGQQQRLNSEQAATTPAHGKRSQAEPAATGEFQPPTTDPAQVATQAESRYAHYTKLAEQAKREGELSAELARLTDHDRSIKAEIKQRRQQEQELLKQCNQAAAAADELSREVPSDEELAAPELQAQLAKLTGAANQPQPGPASRPTNDNIPANVWPPHLRPTVPLTTVQASSRPQPEPRLPGRLTEIVAAQAAQEVRLNPHDRRLLGFDIKLSVALLVILLGGGAWAVVSAMQSSQSTMPAVIYYATPQAANIITATPEQVGVAATEVVVKEEPTMLTITLIPTEQPATATSSPPATPTTTNEPASTTPLATEAQPEEGERLANSLPAESRPTPNPVHDLQAKVVRLQIPGLGIDTPVQSVGIVPSLVKQGGQWVKESAANGRPVMKWDVPKQAVGLQTSDVGCGEAGNIVLNGHSGGAAYVFDRLKDPTTVPPDTYVSCVSASGQQHRYLIYKAAVFDPRDTSFEQLPAGEERHLVLYTCQFGRLDRRIVYFARLEVRG